MRLTWNSTLETGIRQVDLQHQELIELINELEATHESGQDAMALTDVLPRLTSYVLFHFNEEEMISGRVAAKTAHFAQHIAEHRQFADIVANLKFDQSENVAQSVADLIAYLKAWLIEHIMGTDKQLAVIYHAHQRSVKIR